MSSKYNFTVYDPVNPPNGIDPKLITTYKVGIRFQLLGEADENEEEEGVGIQHWVLVFTSNDGSWSMKVELAQTAGVLSFPARLYFGAFDTYPLGVWTGSIDDIIDLMQAHPMRYTTYSAGWNNCQHWVATMLILMEASSTCDTTHGGGGSFRISHMDRYKRCLEPLKQEGNKIYHNFNVAFEFSSSVIGYIGVSLGAATSLDGFYEFMTKEWRKRTKFRDPRRTSKLRRKNSEPFSDEERGAVVVPVLPGWQGTLAAAGAILSSTI